MSFCIYGFRSRERLIQWNNSVNLFAAHWIRFLASALDSFSSFFLLHQPSIYPLLDEGSSKTFHCALSWAFFSHWDPVTFLSPSTQSFWGLSALCLAVWGLCCIIILLHTSESPPVTCPPTATALAMLALALPPELSIHGRKSLA